jgi:hypothetical protein
MQTDPNPVSVACKNDALKFNSGYASTGLTFFGKKMLFRKAPPTQPEVEVLWGQG